MNMAADRARSPDENESFMEAAFAEALARARTDAEAGRVYDGVTSTSLQAFGALDEAEAQQLLENPDLMRRWLAAHAHA
jgi:hypothetical protein